jgi:FkbM family methyltransferase
VELLNTPGASFAFLTWSKFSLSAFKIISRAKLAGVYPKTVIDVGANIGQFSVASSHLFIEAEIFSIEPDPRVVEQLRVNVGKKIKKNIYVTALGETNGKEIFHVNSDTQVSSLLPLGKDRIKSFPNSKVVEKIIIPITTLDALFQDKILAQPILLKIDVQGYEDRVILGGANFLSCVRWILMEVAFSKLYEGERDFASLIKMMQAHGFEFVRPLNFHISPDTGEIIEMDALFESIIVANNGR